MQVYHNNNKSYTSVARNVLRRDALNYETNRHYFQGDHSPDNVKFPDGSRHSSAALGMLSVTHIKPVLVLLSVVRAGMQQCMIQNHVLNI